MFVSSEAVPNSAPGSIQNILYESAFFFLVSPPFLIIWRLAFIGFWEIHMCMNALQGIYGVYIVKE